MTVLRRSVLQLMLSGPYARGCPGVFSGRRARARLERWVNTGQVPFFHCPGRRVGLGSRCHRRIQGHRLFHIVRVQTAGEFA